MKSQNPLFFRERVLIQLTKAERLLKDENYNNKTLDPIRQLIKELREEMNVLRVKTEEKEVIIYKESLCKQT